MTETLSYYQRHKEKILARNKAYYQENKERQRAYNNKYYQEHRVEINMKRRFINNPHLQQWYKEAYQKKKGQQKSDIKIYRLEKLHITISQKGGKIQDNIVRFN